MNKRLIILTLFVLSSLAGCFRVTEAILAPRQNKKVATTKAAPTTKVVVVKALPRVVMTLPVHLPEYRWWYAGYYNLRKYPYQWPPPLRERQLLRWYNEGRRRWWQDNVSSMYWPRPRPRLGHPPRILNPLTVLKPKPRFIIERRTMIPRHTKAAIDRYVDSGIPTAGFLHAVLSNDLFRAAEKADVYNKPLLVDICSYIYSYTPNTCHGSPEKVEAWLKFHRASPEQANTAAGGDRERREHYYETEDAHGH